LGISSSVPLYVLAKDALANTIIVGRQDELGSRELIARDVNWISGEAPRASIRADVKIRYTAKEADALVMPLDGGQIKVQFDAPQRDITAGQAAVFYQGDVLIGGGIINFSRPQNFAVQAFITIISIFVLYLAVPLRLLYQSVLSFTATIGEVLLVVLLVKPSQSTVMFTLLFSLFLANLIGLMISRQIHSYRERTYGEFLRRKEMQEKLEQTNKNLENMVIERTEKLKKTERFAAIGETAGMVGHDLRNPLTGIMNATYYLKKRYVSQIDEKGVEMLKVIEKNAEYSNLIIGDLLDYSRNINLTLVRANLKQVIGDALTIAAVPPSITVVDLMVGSPEVTVDVTMIKRVFVNLIKNAIDAMPQGGKLTIKHETTSDYARIRLSDTGPGISEENLTKIFQPLFTTKKGGIGFGLAFCKRIVEAHNGIISVENIVGQGTQFTVDLPLKLNN